MARQAELELELEVLRNMMRSGGLNLAGQSMATDPTYRSGFDYARSIAGGMPFEDVVAPGMSFSPDQPMGYTQEDLTPRFVGEGPVPVMPSAPTKGTPLEAPYETMPFAPVGTPMPTPFIPGQTSFTGIPNFLKDLDFSSLPSVTPEQIAEPETKGLDFFKVDENLANFQEIADKIDMEEVAKIDIEKIDIPESVSLFSDILNEPVTAEPILAEPTLPSIFDQPTAPVMPTMPMEPMVQPMNEPVIPAQTLPQNIFANIPDFSKIPGLPQTPVKPIPEMPLIPQIPQIAYTPPVPSFVQPNIDEIIRPISRQGKFLPQQPGLFQLA